MDEFTIGELAYKNGYRAGKNEILSEIADILEDCALDNAAMIVSALKDIKERHGEYDDR